MVAGLGVPIFRVFTVSNVEIKAIIQLTIMSRLFNLLPLG